MDKADKKKFSLISPDRSLDLFSLLLVATPFLMLQNYLQEAVRGLSHLSFDLAGLNIPYVLTLFVIVVFAILLVARKQLNIKSFITFIVVILMMALGQKVSDYYINYSFFDLQNNWHYFAYGIFGYIVYRLGKSKNWPTDKIIRQTFVRGFIISAFDEGIQVFISSRIFDISDIAKDIWGLMMGLVIIYFVVEKGLIVKNGWKVRNSRIKDYFKNPFSLIVLMSIFSFIFLYISSVLTDAVYWIEIFLISISAFLVIFFVIHFSQNKLAKTIFISVFALLVVYQGYMLITNIDEGISYRGKNLVIYKGIPIPYFDTMIYPDGSFRLVDKKKFFKGGDIRTFFNQDPDIILIGSGQDGSGGKGFPGTQNIEYPYFVFNTVFNRGIQLIVLKTPEACREFNILREKEKNVLFIIHND